MLYLRGLLTNYQKFLIKHFVGSAWFGHCLCPVLLILPTKCAVFERFINKLSEILDEAVCGKCLVGSLFVSFYSLFWSQNVLYFRGLLTNYHKFLIKQFVGSAWLGHCLCSWERICT